jgi:uncharacterized membrane protein
MMVEAAEVAADGESIAKNSILRPLTWVFIVLFVILTIVDASGLVTDPNGIVQMTGFLCLAVVAWGHGIRRYGIKNMILWFLLTWLVSNFFESLSIMTGFPFGHYHYELAGGPRLFNVPLAIMPTYFGQAYIAWSLSQVLTGQYGKRLRGIWKFVVPFTAALIMTAYDVATDPIASTASSIWIWHGYGEYFGVPISNFAGWVFVVYVFLQLFTLLISGQDGYLGRSRPVVTRRIYWIEAVVVYFFMGVGVVMKAFTRTDHIEIYRSMGLVAFFTVVLIAFISFLNILNTASLPSPARGDGR